MKLFNITTILVASLAASSHAHKTMYIGDLVHDVPQFTNAPDFSLNNAIIGRDFIGTPDKFNNRKSKQRRTEELVDILQSLDPTVQILIYQDHILVLR